MKYIQKLQNCKHPLMSPSPQSPLNDPSFHHTASGTIFQINNLKSAAKPFPPPDPDTQGVFVCAFRGITTRKECHSLDFKRKVRNQRKESVYKNYLKKRK